jgi:hypothetical protein
VGIEPDAIIAGWNEVKRGTSGARVPRLWDGRAAERIVEILLRQATVTLEGPTMPLGV